MTGFMQTTAVEIDEETLEEPVAVVINIDDIVSIIDFEYPAIYLRDGTRFLVSDSFSDITESFDQIGAME